MPAPRKHRRRSRLARHHRLRQRQRNHLHRAERLLRSVGRRLRNMVLGAFAVVLLAFLYGSFVAPLGFLGVVVMMLGILAAMVVFAGWPGTRAPTTAELNKTRLADLPNRAADWLVAARLPLPFDLADDVDALASDIRQLSAPALRLDPASTEAADIERLLARHLPRFIDSYRELPPSARSGADAEAHFRDGLQVLHAEVNRLVADLSEARLQALETEGRFLQSRYRPGND